MNSMLNIDKLDESNYDTWAVQMKNVLIFQDMWDVVTREKNSTDDDSNWKVKDDKALAIMVLSVSPMQLQYIKICTSAKLAWDTLKEVHRPKGPARKVSLFKKLLAMRMGEFESMQTYICQFSAHVEQLAEVGVELQEELFVIMLLASLPSSYENLVVALEARDSLPSLTSLKIKLLEESERRNGHQNGNQNEHAFASRKVNPNKERKPRNEAKERSEQVSGTQQQNQKKDIRCFKCKKIGHYASKCKSATPQVNIQKNGGSLFSAADGHTFLNESIWCLDSGASSHMCCNRDLFEEFKEHSEEILLPGENYMKAEGIGTISLNFKGVEITLVNVLFVPGLQCNFLSVSKAIEHHHTVFFNQDGAKICKKSGDLVLQAQKKGDLFICRQSNATLFSSRKSAEEAMKWHCRYGHINFGSLREMKREHLVSGLEVEVPSDMKCAVCMTSKCVQRPFGNAEHRAKEIGEIIHTDLCGPMKMQSFGGARYLLTFIDDKSRYVFVYFLKHKDDVFSKFQEFHPMFERQTGKRVKILRSDNGTEFVNKNFDSYLRKNGIIRQLTVPYTPQQNGVAERFNRTLIEMARCMLIGAKLDENMWAEAVYTAAYLRNRSPTKALTKRTPYEEFYGIKPEVSHLKVFGSRAVALNKRQKTKFAPRGKEYVMVGYSESSKAYRLFDKEKRELIVSRDVYFIEQIDEKGYDNISIPLIPVSQRKVKEFNSPELPSSSEDTSREISANEQQNESGSDYDSFSEDGEEIKIRNDSPKQPALTTRGRGRPRILRTGTPGRPKKIYNTVNMVCSHEVTIPETVNEALSSEYAGEWWSAMQAEYNSLVANDTWELVEIPSNHKVVSNKWVFALKKDNDGNIERFKARLVAKGCSQKYGVNYTETFSPVVRSETIRMVFALAVEYGLYLHQMDVSSAYINSDLKDEVYMKQPEQFVSEEYPNRVLKLKKALYGLKQSGREWNFKLDSILKDIGFEQCASEPCVYTMYRGGKMNIVAVYVDDLLIASSSKDEMQRIKDGIAQQVKVVDKGEAKYFLSLEIERQGELGEISINQKSQIQKLLKNYSMENCRPVSTPLDPKYQVKCENNDCKLADQVQYQSLIGSLMYIAIHTRPDILHSVSKLSQMNNKPHSEHMNAAKRVLKYLHATQAMSLHYKRTGEPINCFADADWGGDTRDRKSYTGYAFIMAGAVVSYESKKQSTVALSSTEAEYMAMSSACKEATYLKKLFKDMKLQCPDAITLNADNMSAINLVKNPVYHSRSKHIDIKYHHIRDTYQRNEIELNYCASTNNLADILTKNLSKNSHSKCMQMLGIY